MSDASPEPVWPRLLRPARLQIHHARWWKIAFRTLHLMSTGVLLGGHAFGVPAATVEPLLWTAAATGAALIFLEAGPTLHWAFEGWGILALLKLALLGLMPFAWDYRLPILLAVVALGSVGSHMAAHLRHYSFLYGRVIKD